MASDLVRDSGTAGRTSTGFDTLPRQPNDGDPAAWISSEVRAMATAWALGEPVTAAEIMASHPGLGDESAIRLIYEEICLRRDSGQDVATTEIVSRFPRWKDELEVLLGCDRMLRPLLRTAPLPEVGEALGQFRLVHELGRGASGKTFLATEGALADRLVVLKVISGDQDEHLSLARFQHPHIIPLFSEHTFPERGLRALCMPHLGGSSLSRILESIADVPLARREGRHILAALDRIQGTYPSASILDGPCRRFLERVSFDQAICWIGACLADALSESHNHGLIHMDVKPSNLLIAGDGTPLLLDFHLARPPIRAGETIVDRIGGTPGWMAPEHRAALEAVGLGRAVDEAVDHRADIYALGQVLREALGGARAAEDALAGRPWRFRNRSVSIGLADVVDKCLGHVPADRYESAAALGDDLRRHLNNLPLRDAPNRSIAERAAKWRRRHAFSRGQAFRWMLAAGVLAIMGFLGSDAYRQRQNAIHEIESALAVGKGQSVAGQYLDAIKTLSAASGRARAVPGADSIRKALRDELRVAHAGEKRAAVHELAELIRFRFGVELPDEQTARTLAGQIRKLWDERDTLISSEKGVVGSRAETLIQTDLVDLAITWAELRLRNAGADPADGVRRDVLAVVDQAAQYAGPTPRLTRLRLGLDGKNAPADSRPPELSHSVSDSPLEHFDLGRAYLRAGKFPEAAVEFQRVLEVRPQDFWPNFYQGICAYRMGRPEESLAAFRVCVSLAPRSAECYYNRALAAAALGRMAQSRRDYDRALELDPGFTSAWLNRGILAYENGRHDAAISDFHHALKANTDRKTQGRIEYALALALRAHGDRDEAIVAADEAFACGNLEARALRNRLGGESSTNSDR